MAQSGQILSLHLHHLTFISPPQTQTLSFSFQLSQFPPLFISAPDELRRGGMGYTVPFDKGCTSTFLMRNSVLENILSGAAPLNLMCLKKNGGVNGPVNAPPLLIASANVDLPTLSPPSTSHGSWGVTEKHVILRNLQNLIVCEAFIRVEILSSSVLRPTKLVPRAAELRRVGWSCNFKNVDWKPGRNWKGEEPCFAVKLDDYPVAKLTEDGWTNVATCRTVAEFMKLWEEGDNAVMCYQMQNGNGTGLAKNHVLLRGTGDFNIGDWERVSEGGDGITGEYGERIVNVSCLNPKGEVVGWVRISIGLFCGGVLLSDGGEGIDEVVEEEEDWVMKFRDANPSSSIEWNANKTVTGTNLNSSVAGTPVGNAALRLSPRGAGGVGGALSRGRSFSSPDERQGSKVMKSQTWSKGGLTEVGRGKGGPFLRERTPRQGSSRVEPGGGIGKLETPGGFTPGTYDTAESSFFDDSEGLKQRSVMTLSIYGEAESIALGTVPRRKFEADFVSDICAALEVSIDGVKLNGIRGGGILVDFEIEGEGDWIRSLKSQLMDPASSLMQGKVTSGALKLFGEVEYYIEEVEVGAEVEKRKDETVRRSGNFMFSAPHDRTLEVPGATRRKKRREGRMIVTKSEVVPVKLKNGRVARNGERDMPAFLYYFPGGEEDGRKPLRAWKPQAVGGLGKGKRKGGGGGGVAPTLKPEGVNEDDEEVMRAMGLTAGIQNEAGGSNLVREEKLGGGGGTGGGGSVLAKILQEMSANKGEPSVLARMFVELLAVQKQATLRKSLEVNRAQPKSGLEVDGPGLKLDVPPPPSPALSPDEEAELKKWFDSKKQKGTVMMFDLIKHFKNTVKGFVVGALTGGTKLAGDERISWEELMDTVGAAGSLTSKPGGRGGGDDVGFK
ncbi:hypothetical protein TL16_g03843 [Triparma laevis f. inornata]|uniref:Uncharacterized protein n=1 Tax=Triparma laevis f. inornata TaxID=1714386 RepID=A0A9W7A6R4_9STRA|nr:hypothetical protein TL16_g03843 [Triparma laevis f. inornata]